LLKKLAASVKLMDYSKSQSEGKKRMTPQEISSAFNKALTLFGCGFKADQMTLNFVLEFGTLLLWPQDRPLDEMSEEEDTRERNVTTKSEKTEHN